MKKTVGIALLAVVIIIAAIILFNLPQNDPLPSSFTLALSTNGASSGSSRGSDTYFTYVNNTLVVANMSYLSNGVTGVRRCVNTFDVTNKSWKLVFGEFVSITSYNPNQTGYDACPQGNFSSYDIFLTKEGIQKAIKGQIIVSSTDRRCLETNGLTPPSLWCYEILP